MTDNILPWWYTAVDDPSSIAIRHATPVGSPPAFGKEKDKKSTSQLSSKTKSSNQDTLKVKKAWELALAPAKSLPMNIFVSYMSGNSLQMVPITMTIMMFFVGPIKQMMIVNQQFEGLKGSDDINSNILFTKFVYILCNLLAVGAGLWKLNAMGLLPNTRSDWLAWENTPSILEY